MRRLMTEPRPVYDVGGNGHRHPRESGDCECRDKRDAIEALMHEYEMLALILADHRGIAASKAAHALRLALHILDGTTPMVTPTIVAPMVTPPELCAWPSDGCST